MFHTCTSLHFDGWDLISTLLQNLPWLCGSSRYWHT
jgi:hypothetical protein